MIWKRQQRPCTGAPQGSALGEDDRCRVPTPELRAEEVKLEIEPLEERLAPGYPARGAKKTCGWGC